MVPRYGSAPGDGRRRKKGTQNQAIGRSRGGLTTKIVALVDALGSVARFVLLPGHRHDSIGVEPLITGVDFDALIADKAFDNDALRATLNDRGATAVIPAKTLFEFLESLGFGYVIRFRRSWPWMPQLAGVRAFDNRILNGRSPPIAATQVKTLRPLYQGDRSVAVTTYFFSIARINSRTFLSCSSTASPITFNMPRSSDIGTHIFGAMMRGARDRRPLLPRSR